MGAMHRTASHILIVDDDPAIIEALTAALKGAYTVHAAATGKEACAILRDRPIAGIILDAVLGDEAGLDFVEQFRTLSQAPILILTGYSTEELVIRALRAGVRDYLKKPVSLADLRTALGRLVPRDRLPEDPVARARRLMDEHIEEAWGPEDLARQVGLSERHLRRRFREAYGKTPRQYQTEARLQRANHLLRTTPYSIRQIAQGVGCPNPETGHRLFKRYFGLTPSRARLEQQRADTNGQGDVARVG
jgi:YesN/AraC family two-component response regulator